MIIVRTSTVRAKNDIVRVHLAILLSDFFFNSTNIIATISWTVFYLLAWIVDGTVIPPLISIPARVTVTH